MRRGQVLVVIAVLLMVMLLLLAVAVDGGRLYIERGRLARAAQAGADAGMSWVGEQMATLAVPRQTEAAGRPPCVPDAGYGTPGATCTATPLPQNIPQWLTDDDRATLVSPPIRETARAVALDYAARNGLRASDPQVRRLEAVYPYAYDPQGPVLRLLVRATRRATVLLAGLLGREFVDLTAEGLSELPQR